MSLTWSPSISPEFTQTIDQPSVRQFVTMFGKYLGPAFYIKKCRFFLITVEKQTTRPWGAKWSCQYELRNIVLSHNRITHCPSLAQHPIPSSSFTRHLRRFVYILVLTLKWGTTQVSHRAQLRCHAVAACSTIAAEIPTGFHVACRSFSLTQFNLPVVMSMMKHSRL